MFHQTRRTGRVFGLAIVVALLAVSTSGVLAARGGKPQPGTPATLTFDDLAGDAVRSDGLGPYAATIENQIITLSTGKKRSLFFDFSTCHPGFPGCESLFGSATSGTVSDVTMTVSPFGAHFEFNSSGGRFEMDAPGLAVDQFDDDGDGAIDRYVIVSSGTRETWLTRLISKGLRGAPRGEVLGLFSMRWRAEVVVD